MADCAIPHAVCCRPLTAEGLVQSQASACEICGGESGTVHCDRCLSTFACPLSIIALVLLAQKEGKGGNLEVKLSKSSNIFFLTWGLRYLS
jgi:hypothetical protein